METKRLLLDREHLIQMLGRAEFYDACPPFEWLRTNALTRFAEYRASARRNCCGGDWRIISSIVNGFFNVLKDSAPADREYVRDYLTQKKHYIPKPVVLFYRSESTGKPLKFQF